MHHVSRRRAVRQFIRTALAAVGLGHSVGAQEPEGRRTFALTASRYSFDPEVIDVRLNDVVSLTITSSDIAHSFTVDAYRIQKRIPPGGSTTFEFRAEEAGRFPYYCSMRAESGCAEMRGELIVR